MESNGSDPLDIVRRVAIEVGAEDTAREAEALADRVASGRFFVACVGQFKRGKSSLLNALVGRPVLPTGIVPITTVPTVLRYGPSLAARVRTAANGWRSVAPDSLSCYVSEEHNPENALGVEAVEVSVPSAVLADGLCLVDTPGLGSVFEGNTAATRDFLPHVDAAIAVVGVDPPLAGEEVAVIEVIARQAPTVILVLNKADRFGAEERAAAVAFAEQVLRRRLRRPVGRIFQVSATESLARSGCGGDASCAPERDWPALVETLRDVGRRSGRLLVRAAHARGVERIASRCLTELDAQRDALSRPLAESVAHLAELEACTGDAAHRALQLGHLLAADQLELGRAFAARRDRFLAHALPAAAADFDRVFATTSIRYGPALRSSAFTVARRVGRQYVEPWLAEEQSAAEAAYRATADRFIARANEFLGRVRQSGGEYMDRLPDALDQEHGLRVPSRYYFHEILPLVYGSPLRSLLDVMRPPGRQRAVVRTAAIAYLEDLLRMNSTLVQNDLDQRVTDSRQRLDAQIQSLLRSVYAAAERALARARAAHDAGEHAVANALVRLRDLRTSVSALREPAAPDAAAR